MPVKFLREWGCCGDDIPTLVSPLCLSKLLSVQFFGSGDSPVRLFAAPCHKRFTGAMRSTQSKSAVAIVSYAMATALHGRA
jgi:hypothetical protein